jgi:hypothetical protein
VKAALSACVAASIAALALAGCSKVIDDGKAEDAIQADFENNVGVAAKSVDCPGDIDVNAGETFDCIVATERGKATVTLKILNDDADVRITDVKAGGN